MSPDFLPPQHAPRAAELSSDAGSSPGNRKSPNPVRQRRAKPEAEREAKGEASLLAEPCADLAALPKGGGGRTTQLKETPLRLCALATLRFCLFRFLPFSCLFVAALLVALCRKLFQQPCGEGIKNPQVGSDRRDVVPLFFGVRPDARLAPDDGVAPRGKACRGPRFLSGNHRWDA